MMCPLDAETVANCSSELEVHSELLYHDFVRLLADAMRAVSSHADVTSVHHIIVTWAGAAMTRLSHAVSPWAVVLALWIC